MKDLAIVWNSAIGGFDLAIANGDLLLDDGLGTMVLVSLLTDRLAEPADTLPDGRPAGTGDRRGAWQDLALDDAPAYPTANLMGSRLWLLARAKQVTETLRLAEAYASEALAWMTEDGLVGSVTPSATFPSLGRMTLSIAIVKDGASSTYDVAWKQTAGTWTVTSPS